MTAKTNLILIVLAGLALLASSALYTVNETQNALVLQFGRPIDTVRSAGLHVKTPFVQNVLYFDNRLLTYNAEPESYLTIEKKTVVVDSFAVWRITNPLLFYTRVRNVANANARLADLIRSALRAEFGRRTLEQLVSGDRVGLMNTIVGSVERRARDLGLTVVDVRVMRVDLPEKVSQSVFRRMEAERSREAKEYRSRGAEIAVQIRSEAERQRTFILADAYRKAQEIKGQGDAEAARIYAEAFSRDPQFFSLYRRLQAYQQSIGKQDTLVIDPDKDFFRYFLRGPGK
ncbi:protease modulator HflC [Thermithiobacillus plumbiphilus]|uniref:Protein HflC n=1 Tax=Thermithiobacillus plumbiphilus TaxID=1729899 RepID=A0ABU9DB25_9PROT